MTVNLVRHTVLFDFLEDIDEEIAQFFVAMKGLEQLIPGMSGFSGGKQNSSEGLEKNFKHGMTMVFESAAARDVYLVHPEHERVKKIVLPLLKDGLNSVVAIDWDL